MKACTTETSEGWDLLRNPPEFSLVLGGPLFQLFRRAHLTDDALMMVRQRLIIIVLLAWLPLRNRSPPTPQIGHQPPRRCLRMDVTARDDRKPERRPSGYDHTECATVFYQHATEAS